MQLQFQPLRAALRAGYGCCDKAQAAQTIVYGWVVVQRRRASLDALQIGDKAAVNAGKCFEKPFGVPRRQASGGTGSWRQVILPGAQQLPGFAGGFVNQAVGFLLAPLKPGMSKSAST